MDTKKDRIKLLLVDDDEMMRIYFRDIFWIHGRNDTYEVTITPSIVEAEKMFMDKETKPDTIFLDAMMPVLGENNNPDAQIQRTLSFIEKIKNNKDISPTKIIIYSDQKEKSLKDFFSKSGVDGYMIKGELMPKEIVDFTDKLHELNN